MYRFLLTGKWILAFLLCILFSLLCIYLAGWQMDRKDALDFRNSRIAENYDAPAADFSQDGKYFRDYDPHVQWHPVAMTGRYRSEDQVLVRNRPNNGSVGFEVLVPFTTTSGQSVVIDRGWVDGGDTDAHGQPSGKIPAPPKGQVHVVARLQKPEADTGKGAPQGQIASIDLSSLQQRLSYPVGTGAYGIMASEHPAPARAPQSLQRPEQDAGPNLSYSLQWYSFAVLVYVAYAWCARQKVRNDRLDEQLAQELERYYQQFYAPDGTYLGEEPEEVVLRKMEMIDDMPAHMKSIFRPRPQKHRTRPTDEEEEDALLEASEAEGGNPPTPGR